MSTAASAGSPGCKGAEVAGDRAIIMLRGAAGKRDSRDILMEHEPAAKWLLDEYRGLDLTDERGMLCGRMLAGLGAQVTKVEPPGGDQARSIGPFYEDIPHPERSLFWFAWNADKRGITLDIETRDGRDLLRRLAGNADFLLESFDPGYLDDLGLGYSDLRRVNPQLVMTSITAFGQTGPYAAYETSDITLMGMGGYLYMIGEPDRPPLRIGCDQAYLHASGEAAVATVIALYHRSATGQGQHVDVSAQASLVTSTVNAIPFWELNGVVLERSGEYRAGLTAARQRQMWESSDGYVIFYFAGGAFGARANVALAQWLESEGLADDFVRSIEWENFDMALATQEVEDHLEKLVGVLFKRYMTDQLYQEAIRRGLTLCPVSRPADIVKDPQLRARGYWVPVEHDELGRALEQPGPVVRSLAIPDGCRRAPRIGEHNTQVYQGELSLNAEEMLILKQSGVI